MNTVQEALFKAMLQEDWFTASDGDVEWSLGYFGWVHNHPSEWFEVSQAFCEVIEAYDPELELGGAAPEWFTGVFTARINSDGIISITKIGDADASVTNTYDFAHNRHVAVAQRWFADTVHDFIDYNNESE